MKVLDQGLRAQGEKLVQQLTVKTEDALAGFKVDVGATMCEFSNNKNNLTCVTDASIVIDASSK